MHPLFHLLATRPQLLADHAEAYAELVAVEVNRMSATWTRLALLNAMALCSLSVALALAGVALMLWAVMPALPAQAPWVLIVVPLLPLAAAVGCLLAMQRGRPARGLRQSSPTGQSRRLDAARSGGCMSPVPPPDRLALSRERLRQAMQGPAAAASAESGSPASRASPPLARQPEIDTCRRDRHRRADPLVGAASAARRRSGRRRHRHGSGPADGPAPPVATWCWARRWSAA